MTKKIVADDVLGRVSLKQWELFRRVKDGSLNPNTVIASLQSLIENQTERFTIERINWQVSSQVEEISVVETADFKEAVKARGYAWDYNNWQHHQDKSTFELKGNPKKKYKCRIRLARIPEDAEEGVVRTYAAAAGFDFATSWEMLAYIGQSLVGKVINQHTNFIALGDYGTTTYSDVSPISHNYGHIQVADYIKGRTWSFDVKYGKDTVEGLRTRGEVNSFYYILLKEKA